MKNVFCDKAIDVCLCTLRAYFIEGNMEKTLQAFSHRQSSWLGWGEYEFYENYPQIFDTFTSRVDEIPPHTMQEIKSQVLFNESDICIILITCILKPVHSIDKTLVEQGRFTFVIHNENGEPKIVHLHSSAPWKRIKQNEVYPFTKAPENFLKYENELKSGNLPSFTAANTPNGLKCCIAGRDYQAVYINKALYELAGYSSMADMLKATDGNIKNMIYSADLPKVKRIMAAHCSNTPYTINYRLLRKDGTAVWVLERGRYAPTDTDIDYFICSIAPLAQEQNTFNYGTLVNFEEIDNAEIPLDLYFKTALEIIERHDRQTAIEKILKLCCNIAQISGVFIKDISRSGENMPVLARHFNSGSSFVNTLNCTPEDIINRFNSNGINQCSNTALLPDKYKEKLDLLNVKAYLSKTIKANGCTNHVLTFVVLDEPHSWSEYEKDLITQTARLLALLLNNKN